MTNYVPANADIDVSKPTHNEEAAFPNMSQINLHGAASTVTDVYKNFVVVNINDHSVRMAVMQGEYRWHQHPRSDECFLTLEGCLEIDLADGKTVKLLPGEAFNVPAGTVHRTRAATRSVNLCFEHKTAYTDVEFLDDFGK
jgi:mannose-6-phosphate isomerase-like protein (cupin superfamily)